MLCPKHFLPNVGIYKNFCRFANISCTILKPNNAQDFAGLSSRILICARVRAKSSKARTLDIANIPDIQDFLSKKTELQHIAIENADDEIPYLQNPTYDGYPFGKSVYFETYGCQMNVNDAEYAWAVLKQAGFKRVQSYEKADVVLLVTCSIREKAEEKIWYRLASLRGLKRKEPGIGFPKLGVLGCMAERLKQKIVEQEKAVDIIAGPDAYRDLPRLLEQATNDSTTAINVMLSVDETYADIMPVRMNEKSKTAFVSIMRGCDNMCSYCIVPFTRGQERSRPVKSIVDEIKQLSDQGIKQVMLLGQNVNSYRDMSEVQQRPPSHDVAPMSKGFKTIYKPKLGGLRFADLLEKVSQVDSDMRIRFMSPHPKDFPDEVLHLIAEQSNICSHLHLPAQSGSSRVLEAMRRGHTREDYLNLVDRIRSLIPDVSLSTDIITGFCSENESDHMDTVDLIDQKTHAYHKMKDDVSSETKQKRLLQIIDVYQKRLIEANSMFFERPQLILIEKPLEKNPEMLMGRNDGGIKTYIPRAHIPVAKNSQTVVVPKPGDYVVVKVISYKPNSFHAESLYLSNLKKFYSEQCDVKKLLDARNF